MESMPGDGHAITGDERVGLLEEALRSARLDAEVAYVLLGLSGALAEVKTVEATLDKAVRLVPQLLGADRCFAATWDLDQRRFAVSARIGFDDAGAAVLDALAASPQGLPLLREALEGRAPILVPEAARDDRLGPEHALRRRLGAYIVVPLTRWGEEFGGLGLEFAEPRALAAKDEALARGIARQVGVALLNARRFNMLQDLRSFGLSVASRLRLGDVVPEIARGACRLLAADGACLHFLDSSSRSLVLAGATGLPDDLAEGLSRIDALSHPWAQLSEGAVVSLPAGTEPSGIPGAPPHAVAVPVPGSAARMIGVVTIFWARAPSLGPEEKEALSVLAIQSGTAIENAQRFERQRRVAHSLQQGLLALDMPVLKGWAVGAVYEPASDQSEIGGDFYDVFEVTDGRIALVVGDVSGKGAEAAAGTAMAKYMLRAFAMRNAAPSSVLFHLNNALTHGFDDDRFTTAVYMVLDQKTGRCQIAVAGHPAPLLYRAATASVEVLDPEGSLMGAFANQQYEPETLDLHPGDVLLTYTDGLTETRSEGELYGRDRVAASLREHAATLDENGLARRLYEDAERFGRIADDTVVFVLQCAGGSTR